VLLTITTTRAPATDLGYLLHKHPDRPQSFDVSAGQAHVLYPEATPERCTAALLLEVDPIALVRGPAGTSSKRSDGELAQYVNDRPYAASSMLAVAIKEAFRTALTGRCDARPELAAERIPLTIRVPALRCRGGETLAHRVFAPLGWSLDARSQPLRPAEWGDSPYLDLGLTGELRLADALNHLYVLLPVLDDAKHYWVSTEEVDKRAVFVGDLVDRGPDTPGVLRLVMGMVAAGTAFCVAGNHEVKLLKALRGKNIRRSHGLDASMEQLALESEEFRARVEQFIDRLISHYVLDGGRLVVAHAGLIERYHGRASGPNSVGTVRREPDVLDIGDVSGSRVIETAYLPRVGVRDAHAAAALEVMSRFAIDPRWLLYLPPTMSPVATAIRGDLLEHPDQAFDAYRADGVASVLCEEKHMGSRAVLLVCRSPDDAPARFGVRGPGAIWTRTGRPFLAAELTAALLELIRTAAEKAGLFDELSTSWLLLDAELLPWNVKAKSLLRDQYAAVGAAALAPVAPRPGRPARRRCPRVPRHHPPRRGGDRRPRVGRRPREAPQVVGLGRVGPQHPYRGGAVRAAGPEPGLSRVEPLRGDPAEVAGRPGDGGLCVRQPEPPRARAIRSSGVRSSGVRSSGVRSSGVRCSGVRASAVRASAVRASGVRRGQLAPHRDRRLAGQAQRVGQRAVR
jgi:Hen1-like subunit of RNA repair complex/PNKP (polynucleotide 5'-kinase/3'-phosphatase) family adenylyltransferase-like protein/calcineurin-like phosphoesterase family protein